MIFAMGFSEFFGFSEIENLKSSDRKGGLGVCLSRRCLLLIGGAAKLLQIRHVIETSPV